MIEEILLTLPSANLKRYFVFNMNKSNMNSLRVMGCSQEISVKCVDEGLEGDYNPHSDLIHFVFIFFFIIQFILFAEQLSCGFGEHAHFCFLIFFYATFITWIASFQYFFPLNPLLILKIQSHMHHKCFSQLL